MSESSLYDYIGKMRGIVEKKKEDIESISELGRLLVLCSHEFIEHKTNAHGSETLYNQMRSIKEAEYQKLETQGVAKARAKEEAERKYGKYRNYKAESQCIKDFLEYVRVYIDAVKRGQKLRDQYVDYG